MKHLTFVFVFLSPTIYLLCEGLYLSYGWVSIWFDIDRFKMAEESIPKEAAYQIINDELMLDGNPRLNLASFVTTWMEPECDKLILAAINKNYVDMDEYPVTTELQVTNPTNIYISILSSFFIFSFSLFYFFFPSWNVALQ